jgi:hypothetical protein
VLGLAKITLTPHLPSERIAPSTPCSGKPPIEDETITAGGRAAPSVEPMDDYHPSEVAPRRDDRT